MTSDQQMMMAIAAIAVLLVVVVWLLLSRRRSQALRQRFGPEYDHVRQSSKTTAEAERQLVERERRVEKLSLRTLTPDEAVRFRATWRSMQAKFVDDPRGAVVDADRLITEAMRARGYPVDDTDRRLDDLSVDHGHVINHYRSGREIVVRHERGEATTEDLRQAMVHFRALFEELVGADPSHVRRAS
jgi:hypothetical protein